MTDIIRLSREELKTKIKINKNRLEEEIIEQPALFLEVADGCAQAISYEDQAKDTLERLAASIAIDIRRDQTEKLTEAKVEERTITNIAHVEQSRKYLEYKLEAKLWEGLRNSFSQRAKMLEKLIDLYRSGYYGVEIGAEKEYREGRLAEERKKRSVNNAD